MMGSSGKIREALSFKGVGRFSKTTVCRRVNGESVTKKEPQQLLTISEDRQEKKEMRGRSRMRMSVQRCVEVLKDYSR